MCQELGMEAIWHMGVRGFAAFVLAINNKGNDFLEEIDSG